MKLTITFSFLILISHSVLNAQSNLVRDTFEFEVPYGMTLNEKDDNYVAVKYKPIPICLISFISERKTVYIYIGGKDRKYVLMDEECEYVKGVKSANSVSWRLKSKAFGRCSLVINTDAESTSHTLYYNWNENRDDYELGYLLTQGELTMYQTFKKTIKIE